MLGLTNYESYKNVDYQFRAANYLTVAQLFLRNNFMLNRELQFDDLKKVVLGHWGACPGINFLYAHFCRYIKYVKNKNYLILGSGHAAPALLANLYLERSLGYIYPDLDYGIEGLSNFITKFGIDPRLQTEVSPTLPGVIYSGGELGGSLACAIGSILNNPKRSCFCIIGDGEFEAGATMPSLLYKELLNPEKDGFLILAINLNQYKMTSRSIISTWSNDRIKQYFLSFGMKVYFCDLSHDLCGEIFNSIKNLYESWMAQDSSLIPLIILKTQKGTTGPLEIDGRQFVGTHRSHKVYSLKHPNEVSDHVETIDHWLRSYRPEELFQSNGFPAEEIMDNLPPEEYRLGRCLELDLKKQGETLVEIKKVNEIISKNSQKLGTTISPMKVLSLVISQLKQKKCEYFMVFSPDEGLSNQLNEVIEQCGIVGNPAWESSVPLRSNGGLIEFLNENCCHGMLQGYIQTGREGLYVTFEAFAPITASSVSQYYKMLRICDYCNWREKTPSLKYILSSSGWRNSYTHQNPDLLNTLLSKTDHIIDVYFPSDANQAIACFAKMCEKRDSIQVLVAGKTKFKILRSFEQACHDAKRGFWIKDYGSGDKCNKVLYLIAIGDYIVKETMTACEISVNQYEKVYIKMIAPICSEIFSTDRMKWLFDNESSPENVIVVCTGYVNIFRGLFSTSFDIKNWEFLGYKDAFSLNQFDSVLENNDVGWKAILRHIIKRI